ncbi:radical SAM additional 4Fe4S-binding SPASM domain-containing protein [Desulfatibacillum alkenivorans DSM 16219]|jgi:MoaA/NifB/PqqE/SkfB family radical SAM enzyme|uniref:Radical SAM additional 4Fe4S-binding SPASM domain-containing protein n=1 Tax=Desulfatibacillum alkenivorans DSM 16219 TaxID=1121393 RepID=A0A1M6KH67_9BACT|nr:radical SAM protein [Desulfatibacillum alkenivorans]SHJ58278.1 radical SAM additional 4Fe4S-binding SPASM domain-containing protein [Desulfatibacillum alkenivorans DSM 16219]
MEFAPMNGKQLYGIRRLAANLKIGMHPELKGMTIKQKLALNHLSGQSKLTKLGSEYYSNTFTPYFPSPAYDRFLQGLRSIIKNKPWPVVTNFAVTAKCCCNCWHCSFADRDKKDKLTLDVMKNAVKQVQDLGASVIGLTGGEPLLRKDLEEIIASIDERSMPIMFTTGFELTRERVRDLKKAGLKIPVISLDHYTPEIHDKGRNRKGMFDTALKAIELFKSEGFYTAVSFVPSRELVSDRKEIFKVMRFFKHIGVNDMRLTSPILAGKLTEHPDDLLTKENVQTIFEIQKQSTKTPGLPGVFAYDYFESKHFYGCGAGYNYMFIDSQGNVCPCDFTMLSLGNILERPLADIWEETSKKFHKPGNTCYANKIAAAIKAKNPEKFPMSREDTLDIIQECPPASPDETPWLYEKMGE